MASAARYEQRELLEQLMGRDVLRSRSFKKDLELTDPKICKPFLLGICPHDLFQQTKQDIGPCKKIHLEKHKILYEKELSKGKIFKSFEEEVLRVLQKFIKDCDRKVSIENNKLLNSNEVDRNVIEQASRDLFEIENKISIMLKEIEKLVEVKELSKSIEQIDKLNALKIKKEYFNKKLRNLNDNIDQSAQQKLQVCEICASYLSRLDSDRRLSDHFLGKLHLSYVQMRNVYKELKKRQI